MTISYSSSRTEYVAEFFRQSMNDGEDIRIIFQITVTPNLPTINYVIIIDELGYIRDIEREILFVAIFFLKHTRMLPLPSFSSLIYRNRGDRGREQNQSGENSYIDSNRTRYAVMKMMRDEC